jgi:hypothetical protein
LPIIRYFVFIGSLLLALLFVADRYLTPSPDPVRAAEVDRTIIRIHSARALPEKIVFDTSQPMPAPSIVADARPDNDPREAHAMVVTPPIKTEKAAVTPVRHVAERPRAHPRRVSRDRRLAFEQRDLFAGW